MTVCYEILEEAGLVYVRYEGFARIAETMAAFQSYLEDPGFRPGQKQLVDLSRVTGWERDYAALLEIQAKKAEGFLRGPETILVYYAPNPAAREMANVVQRSWEDLDAIVAVVQDSEAGALSVLGFPQTRFDELLKGAV